MELIPPLFCRYKPFSIFLLALLPNKFDIALDKRSDIDFKNRTIKLQPFQQQGRKAFTGKIPLMRLEESYRMRSAEVRVNPVPFLKTRNTFCPTEMLSRLISFPSSSVILSAIFSTDLLNSSPRLDTLNFLSISISFDIFGFFPLSGGFPCLYYFFRRTCSRKTLYFP